MSDDKIEAPWTQSQVDSLNAYQKSHHFHPVCERAEDGTETPLLATKKGWVSRHGGPVVCTWALAHMADWSWREVY